MEQARRFAVWDWVLEQPRDELVLRLTLLLLLLHGASHWTAEIPLRILCGLMLVSRSLEKNRWAWSALALCLLAVNASLYWEIDNHQFLITYWTIACSLAVWSGRADELLAWNARLLIALTFLFATGWKILGGEYVNGHFFSLQLLTDSRFSAFIHLVSGIDLQALAYNRELLRMMKAFPAEGLAAPLAGVAAVRPVALGMSALTLLLEGAIAATFLARLRGEASELGNWLLIVFSVAVYTLTPVAGFGFILVVLGIAQCPAERRELRNGYLWAFILVQFASLPSFGILTSLLD